MSKDYKKVACDELLVNFNDDLKKLQEEKEKLEIEYEKLKVEITLYRKFKRNNEKYNDKYVEVNRKYDDFSFNDIENRIEETQALVKELENIKNSY